MKKKIMILVLMVIGALAVADEVIVKVGQNNVEVRQVYYDSQGQNLMTTSTETYGQTRIDEERAQYEAKIVYWDNVDINAEKAKVQAKLDKLNLIQEKMDE